ncbi:hypothetical protein B0H17DRAFT_1127274 [Mycena rosella]|uniref:Uncharacterized protein n=1 Tax=Mycena rosella TaxID=1033263 RepID=A0AAD7M6F6_MYCRO|nr:hypothetical protein B0H17DRAFT_1127274 [Mycena rosella]
MALQLLGLCLLSTLVYAQNDNISSIALPDPIVAGTFLTFGYVFEAGKPGHVEHYSRVDRKDRGLMPREPGAPVSNTTFRSKTFIMSSSAPFACTTPTWTPVVGLADPGYKPLRLAEPNGRNTFLTNLSTIGTITVRKAPLMTMELLESATGKSAGSVTLNDTTQAYLPVSSFNLTPDAWKAGSPLAL